MNNRFEDRDGNPMPIPERDGICLPLIRSDIQPYACPITGKMITSMSEHRENLKKHGMRVMEPSESPTQGKIRNAAFARKRGLTVSDEFKDFDASEAKRAAHG